MSTPIIPQHLPSQPRLKGRDTDTQRQRGSGLDAKTAPQGVTIAREFTVLGGAALDIAPHIGSSWRDCVEGVALFAHQRTHAERAPVDRDAGARPGVHSLRDTPLIGFYSGVEIAPVNGRSRSLDWTAVLTLHRRS